MKFTCILLAVLVATVSASPIPEWEEVGEEFVTVADNTEDWQLVPDTDGFLHLVDINAVDMEAEPLFVPAADIVIRLRTRQNTGAGFTVGLNNNAQLSASNFVASRPFTVYHIHGWNGGGAATGAAMSTAILNNQDANVFAVDWGVGAQTVNYIAARNRVGGVGGHCANYAVWLNSNGVAYANMVSIGHSLGAHAAGHHGKATPGTIGSIVGLDPAGPLFSVDTPAQRLHHTDANNVQNIVTNGGTLGLHAAIGNNNFFPNGGQSQPGCGLDLAGTCAHERVNPLYSASVNHANVFTSVLCGTTMGSLSANCASAGANQRLGGLPLFAAPVQGTTRVFRLTTSGTAPFALG